MTILNKNSFVKFKIGNTPGALVIGLLDISGCTLEAGVAMSSSTSNRGGKT